MAAKFKPLSEQLEKQEKAIVEELSTVQGKAVDLGGYFAPEPEKCNAVMRPSETFNRILEGVS